jgi:hypothetical protein
VPFGEAVSAQVQEPQVSIAAVDGKSPLAVQTLGVRETGEAIQDAVPRACRRACGERPPETDLPDSKGEIQGLRCASTSLTSAATAAG